MQITARPEVQILNRVGNEPLVDATFLLPMWTSLRNACLEGVVIRSSWSDCIILLSKATNIGRVSHMRRIGYPFFGCPTYFRYSHFRIVHKDNQVEPLGWSAVIQECAFTRFV